MAWWNFKSKKPYIIEAPIGKIDRVGGQYHINLYGEPVSVNFYFDIKSKEEMYKDLFGKKPDKYELFNRHFPPKNPSEAVAEPTDKTLTPKNYRETKIKLDKVDEYYSRLLDEYILEELKNRKASIVFK